MYYEDSVFFKIIQNASEFEAADKILLKFSTKIY